MRPILRRMFVVQDAPFAQCHAATICEAGDRLLAAFFAGTREGAADVGIWTAAADGGSWGCLCQEAQGRSPSGVPMPCWNPVLYQVPDGPTLLFYKVGPDPAHWWGVRMASWDGGATWGQPRRLPAGIWGPIKNKPVRMSDGTLLCPTSGEAIGWQVYVQSTSDFGASWESTGPLNDPDRIAAIQPTILDFGRGSLLMLCRTRQGFISSCRSSDAGTTWSKMGLTSLPNPNSGIDACMLRDGRALLVYNHAGMVDGSWGGPRTPLNIALSADGVRWSAALVLEDDGGEYSYPSVIQAGNGTVHIVYTWRRQNVRHVALDPAELQEVPMLNGCWPGEAGAARAAGFPTPY